MFEKKIFVNIDSLIVGKKKIQWPLIVGVRVQEGKTLESLSPNLPRAEIFLENGQVVVVSNRNAFFSGAPTNNRKSLTCKEAIRLIKENAVNARPILNKWFEWRLLLPLALAEIIALCIGVLKKMPIDSLVLLILVSGIIGAAIGSFWEKKERRKLCQQGRSD